MRVQGRADAADTRQADHSDYSPRHAPRPPARPGARARWHRRAPTGSERWSREPEQVGAEVARRRGGGAAGHPLWGRSVRGERSAETCGARRPHGPSGVDAGAAVDRPTEGPQGSRRGQALAPAAESGAAGLGSRGAWGGSGCRRPRGLLRSGRGACGRGGGRTRAACVLARGAGPRAPGGAAGPAGGGAAARELRPGGSARRIPHPGSWERSFRAHPMPGACFFFLWEERLPRARLHSTLPRCHWRLRLKIQVGSRVRLRFGPRRGARCKMCLYFNFGEIEACISEDHRLGLGLEF